MRERHVPPFDGLRVLAFLAVLAFHLSPVAGPATGGFLGVDLFFVLSSYLVTTALVRELTATGRIDVLGFWTRRLARLYPGLLAFLLAGLLALPPVWPIPPIGERLRDSALVLAGAFNYEVAYHGHPGLLRHCWSLAGELQFYLILPAIVPLFRKLRRPEILLLTLWIAGTMWRGHVLAVAGWDQAYHRLDTRLTGFLAGALIALIPPAAAAGRRWLVPASAVSAAILCALVVLARFGEARALLIACPAAEICAACLLLGIASGRCPAAVAAALSRPALVWLGRRSYGLYLWHLPIAAFFAQWLNLPLAFLATAGATMLVAQISFRWLEVPAYQRIVGAVTAARRRSPEASMVEPAYRAIGRVAT